MTNFHGRHLSKGAPAAGKNARGKRAKVSKSFSNRYQPDRRRDAKAADAVTEGPRSRAQTANKVADRVAKKNAGPRRIAAGKLPPTAVHR